jgi:coatomer protein complex subunit gamma
MHSNSSRRLLFGSRQEYGKNKHDEDGEDRDSPYQGLEKATVLQECRCFHDAQVVTQNPRRCCLLITKFLFLLVRGEAFTSTELIDVFYGVSKLFQSTDVSLRRMTYLFIKEVAETCKDDVIIVTQCLVKDMNTGEDLYRANAMRVLAKIIDSTMLGAIERYLKQAIVDRNAFVASSALMAGLRLFETCPDVVRRWVNEVQESVNSSSDMVQYHSLSLLYKIKQHDRLAVSKVVQQLSRGTLRSPLATCLLIRYTSNLLHEDTTSTNARQAFQFLESCLRHKSEMVIFEAAKTICNLPGVSGSEMNPAVTVLQLFISSNKPSLRFAAMRTLAEVAARHPGVVAKCNDDMEHIVSDPNRAIATLAITTLLKTGNDGSFDRLLKQISSFMSEIGDELKIVVVKAIREHCTKYPQKHRGMVSFLATFLREEGGYDFKKSIVDSIVDLMTVIPDTTETSLLHLCEFIEDCEFSELIVQVLHLIGTYGPKTAVPARYIRFVFNRVILENALVRAAAVSTLGAFATHVLELRTSVSVLIRRSLTDDDDEVRDRAASILRAFQDVASDQLPFMSLEPMPMSFTQLERSMNAFVAHGSSSGASSLTFLTLPIIEDAYVPPQAPTVRSQKKVVAAKEAAAVNDEVNVKDPAAELYKVPELTYLGRAFRSTKEKPLTETEMEYVVNVTKHVFDNHIVLQFSVLNTVNDQRLADVGVNLDIRYDNDEDAYEVEKTVEAPHCKYGEPSNCYVVLKRLRQPSAADIKCQLYFKVETIADRVTGEVENPGDGYDEEYALEDAEITIDDFMTKRSLGDFKRSWEQMDSDFEVREQYALQFKRLDEAVKAVLDLLGMQAADGTGTVPTGDQAKRTHTLHLAGVFLGGVSVLARCMLQLDDQVAGVVLKIAVRSPRQDICDIVSSSIS